MMRVENKLNPERVNSLGIEPNAYPTCPVKRELNKKVESQMATKVIFPEPYQNSIGHYDTKEFKRPEPPKPPEPPPKPMFDLKNLLPMLFSGGISNGNMGEMLKPLLSMFNGGNLGDLTKIMDLFKFNKGKKKEEKKKEDVKENSKFDDFIIIED